jgi:transposase
LSLLPSPVLPVPEQTAHVARAAFPKGNPYLRLRDELGTVFHDPDFADLYPKRGQSALPPWRLALVTVLQFREGLSDRRAADAVRARIDWKYLLGLELTDPGFNFSVLSEFRSRLLAGQAEERLLEKLLARCETLKLIKARGRQRTDATHVLASVRTMNRLELLAETLRAALNELAIAAPLWVRGVAPAAWYERYDRRIEDSRLPHTGEGREAYAQAVGQDGFTLLDRLGAPDAPDGLRELPQARVLRSVWERHFERGNPRVGGAGGPEVRLRPEGDLPESTEAIESPYDTEARYRSSKRGLHWTGYMAHLTETCDEGHPNLITHAETTTAAIHEVNRTAPIQQALADAGRPPGEHLVDAGYVSAELLVSSRDDRSIRLVGPPRKDASWQNRTEGAYDSERFTIDWDRKEVRCPEGRASSTWKEYPEATRGPYVSVWFRASDCRACPVRELCTRSAKQGRNLKLPTQPLYAALKEMRAFVDSEEGRRLYARRAGIEGTISQGVRSFGLRRARYRGLSKAHLQHVATASAVNFSRISDWLGGVPRAATRTSQFARLAA